MNAAPVYPQPPEPDYEMHGLPGAWTILLFAIAFVVLCFTVAVLR